MPENVLPSEFTVILCEDVRQELGNKLSILGFFPTNEIIVPFDAPPLVAINLGILFILRDGEGTFIASFQLFGPLGSIAPNAPTQTIQKLRNGPALVYFGFKPTPFLPEGDYRADLNVSGRVFSANFRIVRGQRPQ